MHQWKAATILPMLYVSQDLTLWHSIAAEVDRMGLGSSAFAAARLVINMYALESQALSEDL